MRFLLLATHYRTPIEYSDERLNETAKALQSFYRFFERYERIAGRSFFASRPVGVAPLAVFADWRSRFLDCMNDDFNTGGAVGVLFELLTELNKHADAAKLDTDKPADTLAEFQAGVGVLRELSSILGLFAEPVKASAGNDELVAGLMQLLLDLRADARKAKNFAVADQIRKRLTELNVTLEDRPGGATDWRVG